VKTVGIITITGGDNYGNKLQTYAVQQVLREAGCRTEVLRRGQESKTRAAAWATEKVNRFSPQHMREVMHSRLHYQFDAKNGCEGKIGVALRNMVYKKQVREVKRRRRAAFDAFDQKFIAESEFTISQDHLPREKLSRYDFFVCGSDQVWNPAFPQTSSIDFLAFAPEEKRIAYAPSFGIGNIPEGLRKQYADWLNGIPHLSVRERRGAEIIRELTGREAAVLVDPSMMLPAEEWLRIARRPEMEIPERFLLTYFLGDETKEYGLFVAGVAKEHGLAVINLHNIREWEQYVIDPSGFLWLLAHAALVCTDSFHGTAFSILLQRDFIAFDRVESGGTMGSRQETLLQLFGLEKRSFRKMVNEVNLFETDFSGVEAILQRERARTIAFLHAALGRLSIDE